MPNSAVQILHEPDQAATVLRPLRLRILELLGKPGSATTLSAELGLPRQHVNYHLRELERVGVIELEEERHRGNCVERVYRTVARSLVVGPDALGAVRPDPRRMDDRRSTDYVVALGSRLMEDAGRLREQNPNAATLAIEVEIGFRSPEERGDFARELAQALAALTAKYHQADASAYRIVAVVHPSAEGGDHE